MFDGAFNSPDFLINTWATGEATKGATVLQEEHKRFREVFAGVCRCVVSDEFFEQVPVKELQLALGRFATFLSSNVLRILFEFFAPSVVRGGVAVGIRSSEGLGEPSVSKEAGVMEEPSVSVFVSDGIAEGQAGLTRLVW